MKSTGVYMDLENQYLVIGQLNKLNAERPIRLSFKGIELRISDIMVTKDGIGIKLVQFEYEHEKEDRKQGIEKAEKLLESLQDLINFAKEEV